MDKTSVHPFPEGEERVSYADTDDSNGNTTTAATTRAERRQERRFRREARQHRRQQIVADQGTRYEEICHHFLDSVRRTIQLDVVGLLAADAGWVRLVRALYADIVGADSFVRSTACDRLMDLVRFCIAHPAVGGTFKPRRANSIGGRASPADDFPGIEFRWMEMRGLALIRDLDIHLRLYEDVRPRLRQFYVDATGFASAHCFGRELACRFDRDKKGVLEFRTMEKHILGELSRQVGSADFLIRDAARTAQIDLDVRRHIRDIINGLRYAR